MVKSAILKFGRHASGYLVRVDGKGMARESPALREFVSQCLDGDRRSRVVLDLNSCDYLDSTMLGCLVALHHRYGREPPAQFLVAADQDTRQKLLSATRVDRCLDVIETAPAIIGQWIEMTLHDARPDDLGQHIMKCHRHLAELGGPEAEAFANIADRLERELNER